MQMFGMQMFASPVVGVRDSEDAFDMRAQVIVRSVGVQIADTLMHIPGSADPVVEGKRGEVALDGRLRLGAGPRLNDDWEKILRRIDATR
jgi:hypothetical protein